MNVQSCSVDTLTTFQLQPSFFRALSLMLSQSQLEVFTFGFVVDLPVCSDIASSTWLKA